MSERPHYQQEAFDRLKERLAKYAPANGIGCGFPENAPLPPRRRARIVLDIDYGWVQLILDMLDELEGVDDGSMVITEVKSVDGNLVVGGFFSHAGAVILDQYIDEAMITCEVTGRQDALWYSDTGKLRNLSPSYVAQLPPTLRHRIEPWDA